jgi:hypothetical protein
MKLFLLFVISAFSLSAIACNREAQFLGTVKNVKYFPQTERTVEHYSYQIKLGHAGDYWFRESIVCPMDEQELEAAVIQVAGAPNKKAGDKIWGVLVFDQKLMDYRLD